MSLNKDWIYLISIGLQLSGSFLLAYSVFKRNYRDIASLAVSKIIIIDKDNNSNIDGVMKILYELYLTRIGFLMLLSGYLLCFFGNSNITRIGSTEQIIYTIILALLFSSFWIYIANHLAKSKEAIVKKYIVKICLKEQQYSR